MDVASKIRKLLELARRGGTPEEAEAAAAAAARLMARYGLQEDDVEAETDGNEIDGASPVDVFEVRGHLPVWMQQLGSGLAKICGCYAWKITQRRPKIRARLVAVGRRRDLAILVALAPAILDTIRALIRRRQREVADDPRNAIFAVAGVRMGGRFSPGSYASGVVYAIIERMRAAQNEVMDEVRRTARQALVPTDWSARAGEAAHAASEIAEARKAAGVDARSVRLGLNDGREVAVPGEHAAITGRLALGGES